jgi:hypothetical protein
MVLGQKVRQLRYRNRVSAKIGFRSNLTDYRHKSYPRERFPVRQSMKTPLKQTPLRESEVWEELEAHARLLLIQEMKQRKVTYKALAVRLEALGLLATADRLNRKVNREKFPASFLLACLKALEVAALDVNGMDITSKGRAARLEAARIEEQRRAVRRRVRAPAE